MSIEKIPPNYAAPYDPFEGIDHGTAVSYVGSRLLSGNRTVRQELADSFNRYKLREPELIERLVARGLYLEPVDEDMCCLDANYSRLTVFNSASAFALVCIDALAYEAGVDRKKWQRVWTEMPERFDVPVPTTEAQRLDVEKCREIGDTLLAKGQRIFEIMEEPYRNLYDSVIDSFPEVHDDHNLFKGSFGFVFGAGRVVIESITVGDLIEARAKQILPSTKGLDEGLRQAVRWDRKIAKAALRTH